jgi:two-component system CheB/CheR fusion protein
VISPEIVKEDSFRNMLALLRLNFGVDFFAYKNSTLNRRISRRMIIHKIDRMEDYLKYLRGNRVELQALYDDFLIGVTGFFREQETFDQLEKEVFPNLVRDKPHDSPVRIWVPGCSTGEEVYSLAISLQRYLGKNNKSMQVQIFGTDVSEKNIEKARQGVYQEGNMETVSAELRKDFFSKKEEGYQINKAIRDLCVFAIQDLTHDPPFSNLDLISCRNVLIYLKPQAQKRIIPLFHYALKQNGFLVLGKSESIGAYDSLFGQVDKAPIYSKKNVPSRVSFRTEMFEPYGKREFAQKITAIEKPLTLVQKQVEKIINRHVPPSIVVNNQMHILMFYGDTSPYISPSPGEASLDLMKMAKADLTLELQTAIFLARKQKLPIKRDRVPYQHNGDRRQVNFEIIPIELRSLDEVYYMIIFEDICPPALNVVDKDANETNVAAQTINEELQKELASTKENLQTIIEEQEATNEELRSALEEVQSSNEELQSTNEELETAKEELQSTNEELNTLNEEIGRRNDELTRMKDDLNNVFNNIDMGVLVLNRDMKIRLFNPTAERMFNLISTDVGRPISDIRTKIEIDDLEKNVRGVVKDLSPLQQRVNDNKSNWYQLRIRPYLTGENKIEGVVISIVDVGAAKNLK